MKEMCEPEDRAVDWTMFHHLNCGAEIWFKHDNNRLNSIEDEVDYETRQQSAGPRARAAVTSHSKRAAVTKRY